ncbi:hypothetical protein AJ80_08437 [Polytolypa hystricis UAMH7299]|uniref:Major facilitator superfamily (MFS) profile domain-containing protein n=1 Tax=Polytolypa hystricis (strain UAMH7299) TaxID=1447883 RepID=A0A2B7X8A3_POLH7|nr:hypothetical protein AJ80_08437 [Polytolypa hystricis UAMH7299]
MTGDTAVDREKQAGELPKWKPRKEEWMVVISIFLLYLMIALDSTIIVPVLPTIASDLNGTATESFWVGTSFLLTNAIFQPFIAVLSDSFGRRALMIVSVTLFTAGTLIGCLAQNFPTLLAGRSVQGIGSGGIYVLGYVILSDIVPLRQRAGFIAIIQIAWAVGTILGPLVGGLFAEHATWRWTFYINFPFCAIGFIMVPISVKLKMQESTFMSKIKRVDWIGGFLFIGSTTIFLMAVSWGGMQFAWDSAGTLVPLIIGTVGILATLVYEFRFVKEPFLRKSLFHNRSAIAAYICTIIQGLQLFVGLYYVPLYFQAVKGRGAIETGLALFPITSALIPASVMTAALIARYGRFRWAVWAGWTIITLATGLVLLFEADTKTAVWATLLVIVGIGHGLVLSSLNLAVQAIAKIENVAHAVMMYSFLRSVGAALGVGIGGAVFQNVMARKLQDLDLPTEISKNAEGYIHTLQGLPDNSVKDGIIDSYLEGIHGVFIVMTTLCGVALILSLFIQKHSMDRGNQSDHVLRKPEITTDLEILTRPSVSQTPIDRRSEYLGISDYEDSIASPSAIEASYAFHHTTPNPSGISTPNNEWKNRI